MRRFFQTGLLLIMIMIQACSKGGTDEASLSSGGTTTTPASNTVALKIVTITEGWITAPDGNKIFVRSAFPTKGGPHPAVIMVPGGIGSGTTLIEAPTTTALIAKGYAVITFNPEGRGSGQRGDLTSEGSEDYNGHIQQDDLKSVIESAQTFTFVDAKSVGVVSLSYGVSLAAGCLARYADDPAVRNIRFFVDTEGPSDSYVIMADPWLLDDVSVNDKTQNLYDLFQRYSLYYDETYLSLNPSSPTVLADNAWWSERAALEYIGSIKVPYLRLQSEWDHMQPPNATYLVGFDRPPLWYQNKHAVDMLNAATNGSCPWTRINGSDIGNAPNATYSHDAPPQYYSGSLEFEAVSSDFSLRLVQTIEEMFALKL
jgi:hypothetical protein